MAVQIPANCWTDKCTKTCQLIPGKGLSIFWVTQPHWKRFYNFSFFQVVVSSKTDIFMGEVCNLHEEEKRSSKTASITSITSLTSSPQTASSTTNESQSPVHKRSIFKSKFLSKINSGSPQKPIAEEQLVPDLVKLFFFVTVNPCW